MPLSLPSHTLRALPCALHSCLSTPGAIIPTGIESTWARLEASASKDKITFATVTPVVHRRALHVSAGPTPLLLKPNVRNHIWPGRARSLPGAQQTRGVIRAP